MQASKVTATDLNEAQKLQQAIAEIGVHVEEGPFYTGKVQKTPEPSESSINLLEARYDLNKEGYKGRRPIPLREYLQTRFKKL